jgi:hypothetical protein
MNIRKSAALLLAGIIILCSPAMPVSAEAAKSMKVHVIHYPVAVTLLPVGDEEGHALGLTRREGQGESDDGEKAKYSTVFSFDVRRGKGGSIEGYTRFDFADGSRIFIAWTAWSTVDKAGVSSSEGQGRIVAGTGRFANIEGTCSFTAKEAKSGAIVAEAVISYTLP